MYLSCVIVARNEEKNIARCIESIERCTKELREIEILLVDSCSSDRTVAIAKGYAVNIVGLRETWQLSPAAGRFTGVNNTSGKYILIIDGDMELLEGWIEAGLDLMNRDLQVATVMGRQYDVYDLQAGTSKSPQFRRPDSWPKDMNKAQPIDYIWGSSIFRRSALLHSGNFQPFLRAEEEAEISQRLRNKGYRLYFIPYDSIYHHCAPDQTFAEMIRRCRHGLSMGIGDMVSWSVRNRFYLMLWKRFKQYLLFPGFIMVSVTSMVSFGAAGKPILSALFGSLMPMFIIIQSFRKGSFYRGLVSFTNLSVISADVFKGLFRRVNGISSYPTDVVWIRRQ
jgi:glycosyltransferase involved in cell wall biosynthesis